MNIMVRKGMPAKHRPTPPCLPENVLRLTRPQNGRNHPLSTAGGSD
jgi:hypothetical protein